MKTRMSFFELLRKEETLLTIWVLNAVLVSLIDDGSNYKTDRSKWDLRLTKEKYSLLGGIASKLSRYIELNQIEGPTKETHLAHVIDKAIDNLCWSDNMNEYSPLRNLWVYRFSFNTVCDLRELLKEWKSKVKGEKDETLKHKIF